MEDSVRICTVVILTALAGVVGCGGGGSSTAGAGGHGGGAGAGSGAGATGGAGTTGVGGAGGDRDAGSDGAAGAAATGVAVNVTVDPVHAVSAMVPTTGGTVSATGADGTTYDLIVPADALLEPTTLTMTPVATVSGIPFGQDGTAQFGVQVEPSGLVFYKAATLVVRPPAGSAPAIDGEIFVQWQGDGQKLQLAAPDPTSAEIHIDVFHLTGFAIVPTKGFNSDVAAALKALVGDAFTQLQNEIAAYLTTQRQLELSGMASDPTPLETVKNDYLPRVESEVIAPLLAAAENSCADGQAAEKTLITYAGWLQKAGLDDTSTPRLYAIAPKVAVVCMQEEYEICQDQHIITRIMRYRLGIERQMQMLGLQNADVSAKCDDLVKGCLKFEVDLDTTATDTVSSVTVVQTMATSSIPIYLQGSVSDWLGKSTGLFHGAGPLESTDYAVTSQDPCVAITGTAPADSKLDVVDLSFTTGDTTVETQGALPVQQSLLKDFQLVFQPSPNVSTFTVDDACPDGTPVALPPIGPNWFTIGSEVLGTENPQNEALGGYVLNSWDINLQPEIGTKMVMYESPSGGTTSSSLELNFVVRHVPSLTPPPPPPTCDLTQACEPGLVLNPDTCACQCPGKGLCPSGSTWDDTSSSCMLSCSPGGSIGGYACVYKGTTTTTTTIDGAAGPSESASVTFTATSIDGCAITYTPTGTATYSPAAGDGCSYSPLSVAMTPTNTTGAFEIGLSPPALVADFATYIDGTVTCGKSSVATRYGLIWMETANGPAPAGEPLVGTSTAPVGPGTQTSSWSLTPQ